MSEETLKNFLRDHARNLDSFLALTPAKTMFGEDVSDQWKKKKQTPEQKKAARMAKLDPANWKTAKDVYDERSAEAAKKRKREQEEAESESNEPSKKLKHEKPTRESHPITTEKIGERSRDSVQNKNLIKRAKKRAAQKEKNAEKRERRELDKAQKSATRLGNDKDDSSVQQSKQQKPVMDREQSSRKTQSQKPKRTETETETSRGAHHDLNEPKKRGRKEEQSTTEERDEEWSDIDDEESIGDDELESQANEQIDEDDEDDDVDDEGSTATSSEGVPDILSPQHDSASSSVSSIVPPPAALQSSQLHSRKEMQPGASVKSTKLQPQIQSEAERQAARQRLQEQISQFRSQRKADEKPARSRAELLDQRRRKEQERKAAKKEQRRKEREEEAKRQDEEMAKRFSPGGSGSLLASPRSPMTDDGGSSNAFTFGRIAFEDGSQFDPMTGTASAVKKHKGPADPASALKAAQAKDSRIAGLDEQKRQNIAEKDMWLNARKKAHGERVKDDTSLLKKALKRQEKQKQRSEKDWDKRVEGVRSAQDAKQKKRTENIQKRKDEKSAKKSGQKKKVKRPGFEGSFRGRTSKTKKS